MCPPSLCKHVTKCRTASYFCLRPVKHRLSRRPAAHNDTAILQNNVLVVDVNFPLVSTVNACGKTLEGREGERREKRRSAGSLLLLEPFHWKRWRAGNKEKHLSGLEKDARQLIYGLLHWASSPCNVRSCSGLAGAPGRWRERNPIYWSLNWRLNDSCSTSTLHHIKSCFYCSSILAVLKWGTSSSGSRLWSWQTRSTRKWIQNINEWTLEVTEQQYERGKAKS